MWQSYGSVEASPPKPISVSEILREVIKGVAAIATQNGVELHASICDDQCVLLGDGVQIQRAIQNVVINALQASAETKGRVAIECTQKDFYVDLRVEDTGAGIAPAQIHSPAPITSNVRTGSPIAPADRTSSYNQPH